MVEVDGNQGSVQVLLAVRALTLERMKSYIQETATLKLQRELVIKKVTEWLFLFIIAL